MPAAPQVAQVESRGTPMRASLPSRRETFWEREGVTPSHLLSFPFPTHLNLNVNQTAPSPLDLRAPSRDVGTTAL